MIRLLQPPEKPKFGVSRPLNQSIFLHLIHNDDQSGHHIFTICLKIISSAANSEKQTNKAVTYTMMLLMGMWMSLTKNPMKPIMAKPIAVAMAIFWNSGRRGKQEHKQLTEMPKAHVFGRVQQSNEGSATLPFLSGLVHLLTSLMESFTNCRLGSMNCVTWSMAFGLWAQIN